MRKSHSIGLAIVALILALGTGWWSWSSWQQNRTELVTQIEDLEQEVAELESESNNSDSGQSPSLSSADTAADDSTFQLVTDQANLYTIQAPAAWQVEDSQGPKGVQVSYLQLVSPDFSVRTDPTAEGPFEPVFYEAGAVLTIHVTEGEEGTIPAGEVYETIELVVADQPATWTRFREPSTVEGELIQVSFNADGNNYLLRLGYNPTTFPTAPETLQTILNSWQFPDTP